jgi:DNA-binding SARP family transcriptional activator
MHLPLVHAGPSTLSLETGVQVDLHVAAARAQELIDKRHPLRDVSETLRLLRQELLSDWSEDWVMIEQERFRQLRLHGLETLSELLTSSGRHAEAVNVGLEAMACDPLRESAHRLLMTAYLAEGNRKEAINQFHLCARILHDELGLGPSAEMTRLLRQVTSPAG